MDCNLCQPNFYLQKNQTLTFCSNCQSSGMFINGSYCSFCQPACQDCHNSISCDSCKFPFFLNLLNSTCQISCPDGYFEDVLTRKCQICNSNCSTCFGANDSQCYSCSQGLFKFQTSCLAICPDNLTNNSNYSCIGLLTILLTINN